MKRQLTFLLALVCGFFVLFSCGADKQSSTSENQTQIEESDTSEKPDLTPVPQTGDIIFHHSMGSQSKAIENATNFEYTHCGIVVVKNKSILVFEAGNPVQLNTMEEFVERGKDKKFVIKRLKNAHHLFTPAQDDRMQLVAKDYVGKKYDIHFQWSDDEIYCSELVWKIFKRALNIELCPLNTIKTFDLSSAEAQRLIKARFPKGINENELAVSPRDIFQSDLLVTVPMGQ